VHCFCVCSCTWLIKSLNGRFAPILAIMINSSLCTSQFPASHKHAVVKPILKKSSLDPAQLANCNYRPVSNLSFMSKLFERFVVAEITKYLNDNDLFPPLQSAYRPRHSTETAVIMIFNDALLAVDQGMITLVVLLDYSAAFDTVDHQITIDILENRCGISTSSLAWCCSYLSDRSFSVPCNTEILAIVNLTCSLPKESILGPLLYVTYASELQDVAESHDVGFR